MRAKFTDNAFKLVARKFCESISPKVQRSVTIATTASGTAYGAEFT